MQNAECRMQNAERRMQNAECRMQNAELYAASGIVNCTLRCMNRYLFDNMN